jgi:iron complex outermembrane receptor protein
MYSQESLSGWVKNQSDKRLENVIVKNLKTNAIQYSDATGFFTILADYSDRIEFSYLGYETLFVSMDSALSLPMELKLRSVSLESETVTVYGEANPLKAKKWVNTIDDVLQSSSGVQMLSRANFSREVSVRGLASNAISVKIDGMYIYPACVDHMDPVTNYVEVENLDRIKLNKSNTSENAATTIDMITNRADFKEGFQFKTDLDYESVSSLQKIRSILNYSDSIAAVRLSYSQRNSGDYYAAKRHRVDNSQYEKQNYMFNYRRNVAKNYQIDFSFIGDDAFDVGYPVLIMDATKAQSRMYRLSLSDHNAEDFGRLTFYHNRVDHWMDDYQRDVTARRVMPNMFMPMFGYTRTTGAFYERKIAWYHTNTKIKVDYHYLDAFADMKMIPLDPLASEAYVLNIGDARSHNFVLTLNDLWYESEKEHFSTTFKLEQNNKYLDNKDARSSLSGFWDKKNFDYSARAFSFNLSYEMFVREYQIRLSYGRSERIPSHQETYAFFLYNPIDDYFYTGNPNLKTEKSNQLSGLFAYVRDNFQFKFEPYANFLSDYVYGLYASEEWKLYQNLDHVFISGFESELSYNFLPKIETVLKFDYTYAYNEDLDEPLLMIAPFSLGLKVAYIDAKKQLVAEFEYFAKQDRIAFRSSEEDRTEAYHLLHLRYNWSFLEQYELRLGIENIFDTQYHPHLSVNNLSGKGRNFYLGFSYSLE